MKAAQTGFARKVNDLTRDLEDYNKDRLMYEKKRDMHSRELETFIAKLESIDNEIAALCPQLVLDSPQGRCKSRNLHTCMCLEVIARAPSGFFKR